MKERKQHYAGLRRKGFAYVLLRVGILKFGIPWAVAASLIVELIRFGLTDFVLSRYLESLLIYVIAGVVVAGPIFGAILWNRIAKDA